VVGVVLFFALGLGDIADEHGLRCALLALSPFWVVGGAVVMSAGKFVADDVTRAFAPTPA
jgi:hypothetical protein